MGSARIISQTEERNKDYLIMKKLQAWMVMGAIALGTVGGAMATEEKKHAEKHDDKKEHKDKKDDHKKKEKH